MKKWIYNLFILSFILYGCVVEQSELQDLKIRVINLETLVNQKCEQKISNLEKRTSQLENQFAKLNKQIGQNLTNQVLNIKAEILADLEDLKHEYSLLSEKLEELQFNNEAKDKEYRKKLENILTYLQALELRLKTIETKLGITPSSINKFWETGNLTSLNVTQESITQQQNVTLTKNATLLKPIVEGNITSQGNQENKTLTQKLIEIKAEKKEAELYQKAFNLYEKGEIEEAKKLFQEYIKTYPNGKWVGQSYFWIGEIYFKQKDYENAILNYQKLIELSGWHPLKPTAMLKEALAFKAIGDKEVYKILLKKLLREYPQSKEAQKAKKLLNL